MTAQVPDTIRLQDENYALLNNPLELYLTGNRPSFVWWSTACWRRYIADWEVKDELLYLVGIKGWVPDETQGALSARERLQLNMGKIREATLEDICPGHSGSICAAWYSGPLRIPVGRLLHHVHSGYGSTYEEELILSVEEGRIARQERLSYSNARQRRRLEEMARRGVLTEYFERGFDLERIFREDPAEGV